MHIQSRQVYQENTFFVCIAIIIVMLIVIYLSISIHYQYDCHLIIQYSKPL